MLEGTSLPNFYKPRLFYNPPKRIDSKNTEQFPLPADGKFYTINEIKRKSIETAIIEKVVYPKDGGIETYLQYYRFPYKGFPNAQLVYIIGLIKGVIPIGADFLSVILKNPFLLFSINRGIKKTLPRILMYAHRLLEEFAPDDGMLYSRAVREVYRVFIPETTMIHPKDRDEIDRDKKLFWIKIRDLFCLILEFDNAYRYPFQDVFCELNTRQLRKRPIREIRRVFDLYIKRQNYPHLADKYRKLKLAITFILLFNPKLKKKVVEIMSRLDVTQLKPDEGDLYFFKTRTDFKYNSIN